MAGGIKKAGGISFGVSMSTGQLSKDVTKARKTMGGFVSGTTKQLGGLKAALSGVGAQLAAAFSVASVGAFVRSQFNAIDALYDTSKALGVTTEALSRLNYAAELSGSSAEAVERGLAKMAKSTRDATLGLETSARAYRKLGLDAAALHKLSPEQQFLEIADAVKNLGSAQDQLTVTQDIFGRGAAELVETLRLGRAGLEGMALEADKLGITINSIDAQNVNEAKDALDKIGKSLGGLGNMLAVTIAPAVNTIADGLTRWLTTLRDFKREAGQLPEIFKYLAPTLFGAPDLSVSSQPGLPKPYLRGTGTHQNPAPESSPVAQAMGSPVPHVGVPRSSNWGMSGEAFADKLKSTFGGIGGLDLGKIGHASAAGYRQGAWHPDDFETADNIDSATAKLSGTTLADALGGKLQELGWDASRMMRSTGISDIWRGAKRVGGKVGDSIMGNGKKRERQTIGDFDAARSGSLASYQQRVRGAQQFGNVDEKQLKAQEQSRDYLKTIADNLPMWGLVGGKN